MANARRAARLDDQAIAVVDEFIRIRAEIRKLEKLKKHAEAVIYEALGDAQRGIAPDGTEVIAVSHRERTGIDREVLEKEFPEALKAAAISTEYDVLMTSQ